MADGDQRIEVLEDEMKVLKGEVSRTLVDLRALLMREESPLMTGGLLQRVAASADVAPTVTTQVNLAPVAELPSSNVSIIAPAAPNQEPSVISVLPGQDSSGLAGLPGLGSIEMPEAPGAPDGALFPSQGDEIPGAPAAPPPNPPTAPSAGDLAPPRSGPGPGTGPEPEPAATSDSGWEEERDEERSRQRKARQREDDIKDEEQRVRRRENDRLEDDADRERRDGKRRDDDEDDKREDRKRRDRFDQYDSEMEDERGRLDQLRHRGHELESELDDELEDELDGLSNSRRLEEHEDTGLDAVSGLGSFGQETEDHKDFMGLETTAPETSAENSGNDKDDGHWPDELSDGHAGGASSEHGLEFEFDFPTQADEEDEIGDEYAARHDNGYADDRDGDLGYPARVEQPQFGPDDNFDSHEYQEEPKINGNNGSQRPRRPDADQRAYEDSYYEDQNQDFVRESQSRPRSQRASRPSPDGGGDPRGRRRQAPPGNYGYAPPENYGYAPPESYGYARNEGNGQWAQPPAGYQPGNQPWPAPHEWTPEPAPMDLNLVSSLVRWASLAKYRVGEKRLSDIIELYVESRSATPGLKDALTHIAGIVDDQPPESGQSAQETLDLIAHLHGILTAALPVPEVPKLKSQISFVAGKTNGNGNSNGNGDW